MLLLADIRSKNEAEGVKQPVKEDRAQVLKFLEENFEANKSNKRESFPDQLWQTAINEAEGLKAR
jgi:hypothetical protein